MSSCWAILESEVIIAAGWTMASGFRTAVCSDSRELCLLNTEVITTAPSSVISECTPRPHSQSYSERDLTSFGDEYDESILQIIHAHLELDSHHLLAYVGPMRGNMASKIERRFCLLQPVTILYPGGVTYTDITSSSRRLAIKLGGTGAEEFFTEASTNSRRRRKFDRILINNSIQDMNDYATVFSHMKMCLHTCGKILILHRPASITTLPIFNKARIVLSDAETPFMEIITALQRAGCEVKWDLEHIPIIMTKLKWIALLRSRFPVELEIMSNAEVEDGIRELLTGQLNYMTNEMEIEDRLIIITGSLPDAPGKFTTVQRIVARPQLPYSALLDLEYELTLTEPMKNILQSITNKPIQS